MLDAASSPRFPRLYAAASLKPVHQGITRRLDVAGFPRLYAAASLKHRYSWYYVSV